MRKIGDKVIADGLPHIVVRLVRERMDCGISQMVLAHEIGVEVSTLCDWENGKHSPRLNHLMRWAKALDLKLILRENW